MTATDVHTDRNPGASRLEGLDALRGIAALLVVIMHILHVADNAGIFRHAYLAVDLFFGLSGYVMARNYEHKFANGMRAADFGAVRLKRLWPTMCAGALFGFVTYLTFDNVFSSLLMFLLAVAFVPMLRDPLPLFPTNIPAWSILFELFANAAHVLVLRRLGCRSLVALMLAGAAVLVSYSNTLDLGGGRSTMALGIARVTYSYCAGILIWRLNGDRAFLPCWFGLFAFLAAVLGSGAMSLSSGWDQFAIVFLLFPLILLSGLSPLPFGRRFLPFMGAISFPLYAVHFPVIMAVANAGYGPMEMLAASIVAAILVLFAVERRTFLRHIRMPVRSSCA